MRGHLPALNIALQVKAISLLTDTAKYCDDDTRLQRIVPYLIVSFSGLNFQLHLMHQKCLSCTFSDRVHLKFDRRNLLELLAHSSILQQLLCPFQLATSAVAKHLA